MISLRGNLRKKKHQFMRTCILFQLALKVYTFKTIKAGTYTKSNPNCGFTQVVDLSDSL